jgi:hypothetical protein
LTSILLNMKGPLIRHKKASLKKRRNDDKEKN